MADGGWISMHYQAIYPRSRLCGRITPSPTSALLLAIRHTPPVIRSRALVGGGGGVWPHEPFQDFSHPRVGVCCAWAFAWVSSEPFRCCFLEWLPGLRIALASLSPQAQVLLQLPRSRDTWRVRACRFQNPPGRRA